MQMLQAHPARLASLCSKVVVSAFAFVLLVKDGRDAALTGACDATGIPARLVEHPVHARYTAVAVVGDEVEEVLAQV
jgi:hypothetical protein